MNSLQDHFDEAHTYLKDCLTAFQHHELHLALTKLRSSLLAIEESAAAELEAHAKKNVTLFVGMFQFELLARDEIWARTPKLYSAIGNSIHTQYEYENEFRHNVIKQNLGRLLDFTN